MATTSATGIPVARGGAFSALRYRGIQLIVFGTTFAFTSFWTFNVAQGWLVLELTDSPALVGIVSACSNFPFLVISLFAGVVADRLDRRRVCLFSRVIVVGMMLTEATLYWTGLIEIWMMVILALGAGVGFSLDNPVRQSMVPDLVPPDELANAVALTFGFNNLTNILGPSIAGALLALAGPGWCFFGTAVGNFMLFSSYLPLKLPPRKVDRATSPMAQLKQGLRWVRRDEVFYTLMIAAGMTAFVQPYQAMMPVFAKKALDVGTVQLGILLAAPGFGAVVGSFAVASAGRRGERGKLLFAGSLIAAMGLLAFSVAPNFLVALPLLAILGMANAFFMTLNNTIVLGRAPAELRGRIMSAVIVVWGLSPLGATVAGFVAGLTDVRISLAGGALLAFAVTSTILLRRPSLREL